MARKTATPEPEEERQVRRRQGDKTRLAFALNNVLSVMGLMAAAIQEATEGGFEFSDETYRLPEVEDGEDAFEAIPEVLHGRNVLEEIGFEARPSTMQEIERIKQEMTEVDMAADDAPRRLQQLAKELRAAQAGRISG